MLSEIRTPRLIRISDVTRLTGLSRSRLYELERDGRFPARRQLSQRAVAWSESEIVEWIESRPLARDSVIASVATATFSSRSTRQ